MADDLLVVGLAAAAAPWWVGPAMLAAGVTAAAWWAVTSRPHVRVMRGIMRTTGCACGTAQGGRR